MKKIRNKITIAIIFCVVLTAIFVGVISIYKTSKIINKEASGRLINLVESHGKDFEKRLSKMEYFAKMLEGIVKSTIDTSFIKNDSVNMEIYKQSILPQIIGVANEIKPLSYWIIFNPQITKGGHILSYYDFDKDGIYTRAEDYNVLKVDTTTTFMEWWYYAQNDGDIWTKPYYWEPWDIEIISYSKAIYVDNKLIGVCGTDFDVEQLKSEINSIKLYETGYVWIIDDDLNFITHPNLTGVNVRDMEEGRFVNLFDTIYSDSELSGILPYSYGGEDKIMAYYKLSNGWIMGASPTVSELMFGVRNTAITIIFVILSGILISGLIALYLSKNLSKPISSLVDTLRIAAKGDLSVRANISTNDELKELGENFNLFISAFDTKISELNTSQKCLKEAKVKAEEADKLKSAFLANVSHEIRTPLNAIVGFSNFLAKPELSEEKRIKYVNYIEEGNNNLIRIIDEIIDISQIETDQLFIKFTKCNINSILIEIYNTFEILKNSRDKSHIDIDLKLPKNKKNFTIETDCLRLKQVIYNLIDNALKYTHEGYVKFGYTVTSDEVVEFFVKDTGIGIDKENLDLIFDRFRQADDDIRLKYGGMGLGLTIVKNIVSLLKGRLKVRSIKGQGSQFYFSLPVNQSLNISDSDKTQIDMMQIYNWKNKNVLVVEDDVNNYNYFDELLNEFNANVIWARDGREAIRKVKSESVIDLVIMDVKMPVMDGYEATIKIKEIDNNIPVVIQTAYILEENRRSEVEAICQGYFTKPIKPELFVEAIDNLLMKK